MIKDVKVGDITADRNPADIIIGMNSTLTEVTGIGLPFVNKIQTIHPIVLGSVLSFTFQRERNLHMVICHTIGEGGWVDADKHVRFGLDYLWHTEQAERQFSAVQIGTGRIGRRDKADHAAIRSAIAMSYLPVDLYVYEATAQAVVAQANAMPPLKAYRAWHPVYGEERIHA